MEKSKTPRSSFSLSDFPGSALLLVFRQLEAPDADLRKNNGPPKDRNDMWAAWDTFFAALPVAGAAGAATPKQIAVNTTKEDTDPTILSAGMLVAICSAMFLLNTGSRKNEKIENGKMEKT